MPSQMPDPTIAGPTTPTPSQRDANDEADRKREAEYAVRGSVKHVKEWVTAADTRTRAQSALAAENARPAQRTTLVEWLEKRTES